MRASHTTFVQTTFLGRGALLASREAIDFENADERIGLTLNGCREILLISLEGDRDAALKEWRDACCDLTTAQLSGDSAGAAAARSRKDDAEKRANEASAKLADIALAKRLSKHLPANSKPLEVLRQAASTFSWCKAADILQATGDSDAQDLAARCHGYSGMNRFSSLNADLFRNLRDDILSWADGFKPEEVQ